MTTSGWQLRRISGPAAEPITLAQAKAQCRVDDDITEDDTWLTDAIREARAHVEDQLKSTLVETVYELKRTGWPTWTDRNPSNAIPLPFGPIIAVDSVHYLDTNGVEQALDGTAYRLVKTGTTGHLLPGYRAAWPATRAQVGGTTIVYRAGYESAGSPAGADGVPPPVLRGIKLLVGHWYKNRESVLTGTISKEMEQGLNAVIGPYRNLP